MSDARKVYSSELGALCPECGQAAARCSCHKTRGDGVARVRRETKGRGGKSVTVILGLPLSREELKEVASQLKRRFAVGGAVKEDNIEIQGDFADSAVAFLKERGFRAKRAGG